MPTTNDYLNLITSEYRLKPNFVSVVSINVAVGARVQELLLSMIPLFDVDIAIGNQLDIIGQWVGVSRNVNIPASGIFFSWDGDYSEGWDFGTWKPSDGAGDITSLPDDAYRTLIKAKIAANQWNGTTEGAYAIWDSVFQGVTILIQDNLDMSYDLILVGGIVDSLTLALLTGGYIPLKPEGVKVNTYYTPVNTGPAFAWDVESTYLAGWDTGSWLREANA